MHGSYDKFLKLRIRLLSKFSLVFFIGYSCRLETGLLFVRLIKRSDSIKTVWWALMYHKMALINLLFDHTYSYSFEYWMIHKTSN